MNRIHVIALRSGSQVTTRCGMTGFVIRNAVTEFDTVGGGRFEAVTAVNKGATCKRCMKPCELAIVRTGAIVT
jgi:hypothetical protein